MTDHVAQRSAPDVSFLLAHASHVLATRMAAALAEAGMSPREHCVLTHALAGQRTQSELARLSDLDKTTMVVTMDRLEQAGYAERRPSAADRRARIVAVTADGERAVATSQRIVDRVHREVLEALPPGDRDVFVRALTSLVDGLLAESVESERAVRRPRQPHS